MLSFIFFFRKTLKLAYSFVYIYVWNETWVIIKFYNLRFSFDITGYLDLLLFMLYLSLNYIILYYILV
uniref:Hypothetical secreted peptide n=1 Tax=Glossina morsitans morsitans TaxID=37546 RepID=D3TSM5_GLOMM